MTLTPRQIAAWLEFGDRLDRIDRANDLVMAAVGAQGDKQAIEKTLKELGGMKLVFSAQEAAIKKLLEEAESKIEAAAAGAVQDAAKLAVNEGRANIAGAGFPASWQKALTYNFYPNEGSDPAALIFDRIPFAGVFETGMTIRGRPLLWLPIERNLPSGVKSPKQYGRKLVSVNIAGKPPLMFDAANRLLGPLFVGVRSVDIRKRFDLLRIFAAAAARVGEFYEKRMKG